MRKWGDSAPSTADMDALDFSSDKGADRESDSRNINDLVDKQSMGQKKNGMYEIKDWEYNRGRATAAAGMDDEDDDDDIISRALEAAAAANNAPTPAPTSGGIGSTLGSLFSRITGSKALTQEELAPILAGMKEHLMKKNVAKEIAEKVCDGVGETLIGKKVGGFNGM